MHTVSYSWISKILMIFAFWNGSHGMPPAHGATPQSALRPADLIEHPERYLGRAVEIEIVERLLGPVTQRAEYGHVQVQARERWAAEFYLVPAAFRMEDPRRYKHQFDGIVKGPLQVRGELLRDEEMSQPNRPYYVFRVATMKPLSLGAPKPLAAIAEIKADPARWDRQLVVYEGVYREASEASTLDGEIWLSMDPQAQVIGTRTVGAFGAERKDRVRVTGILLAKPGARYGHLGGSAYELIASKLEYLGARQEEKGE